MFGLNDNKPKSWKKLEAEYKRFKNVQMKDLFASDEKRSAKYTLKLKDLVLDYSLSQNLSFSSEDIAALNKLVNVELESDFVTDLRTDKQRTLEMETQMLLRDDELKKPSEVKILNVKNLLPNLSD